MLGAACSLLAAPWLARPVAAETELPKAYLQNASRLVKTLRASIEADVGGLDEAEVRRLADPSKELVREFMTRWRGVPLVQDDETYHLITAAIRDLGQFYLRSGARARLPADLGRSLLDQLDAALGLLPDVPPPSLFPF